MSRFTVRIAGGGDPGPTGRAAIAEAVERALSRRGSEQPLPESAWARAGRLEAISGAQVLARRRLSEH